MRKNPIEKQNYWQENKENQGVKVHSFFLLAPYMLMSKKTRRMMITSNNPAPMSKPYIVAPMTMAKEIIGRI